MSTLVYRLLWSIILVLAFVPQGARAADSMRFFCVSEEAAITLARSMEVHQGQITNQPEVDKVAYSLINDGVCVFLPEEVEITVVRTIGVFGLGTKAKVVEFVSDHVSSDTPLYSFMPYTDSSA
jgi:hypothetical protein